MELALDIAQQPEGGGRTRSAVVVGAAVRGFAKDDLDRAVGVLGRADDGDAYPLAPATFDQVRHVVLAASGHTRSIGTPTP
jgi:hypothetical protein